MEVGTMNEDQIRSLFERVGRAMSGGDMQTLSGCWEVPAWVLADEGGIAVADTAQIEGFFAQAGDWYRTQGLVSTRPELERVDMLSEKLAAIEVRWPAFDAAGEEKFSERSHYIVQLSSDGQARIQVTLTRTA
jgi:hypothetical protein